MRSVLVLESISGHGSSRQSLSRRAAAAAIKAAQALSPIKGRGLSAKAPSVKKLRSGQPVLDLPSGRIQTHISISHVADTVAGFAAAESV